MRRPTALETGLLTLFVLVLVGGVVLILPPHGPEVRALIGILPTAPPTATPVPPLAPLPRGYGVALSSRTTTAQDLDRLGPVWYYDPRVDSPDAKNHPRIMIVPQQPALTDNALRALVTAHPGHWWILGGDTANLAQDANPDPAGYARFFAHAAAAIRAADPTAGLMPRGIGNADTGWAASFRDHYRQLTGVAPPVDAWNIHDFLLDTQDPADFYEFKHRIEKFRDWMDTVGEGRKPLVVSGFGVLYGAGCCGQPLVPTFRVQEFMRLALEWLELDGQVQSWAWVPLESGDREYNGALLDRVDPSGLSQVGQQYADRARAFSPP